MPIVEFQDFMNQGFNCGLCGFYTNIAGFTMLMMSATINVHYDI